ncbi:MAG: NYN domain-containing protein [Chloroflexi bacterium AL-W]|nr:NYN domain-containing protein [Chloroflexi bacterium AL-N1]NOK65012.1 NYN domain-containing protein [Chloroflexi bacterium AL-N10]NOK76782.1 NYN domain-containing protein [Chloroflexi bacterium AL-N5]NOK84674.1 NYN domain-containing protein [Chloroflexi bacterium AL-W]NOK86502.1 NYN domain-containing protein [Chloroflexi bacterium AL-N15]
MLNNPKLVAKIEAEEPAQRLAVLIDADNAQAAIIEGLLFEIASLGEATVKRIYGDFTSPASAQWKKVLNKFAIKPVQQFAYTSGKNATDSTLIIDAMDLLYTRRFHGFCLVSSDSDFTGLAVRIREEGLVVFGFGEKKTPESFRNACNKFIFTEVLRSVEQVPLTHTTPNIDHTASSTSKSSSSTSSSPIGDVLPYALFQQALEQAGDENGWTTLANFGSQLTKLRSDFDARNFGYKKLSDLVRAQTELFTLQERETANSDTKVLYIRSKKSIA